MAKFFLLLAIVALAPFIQTLNAQTLDSATLAKVGHKMVRMEIQQGEGTKKNNDNCLRDKDGNPDAVFQFMDEGLGGGSNALGFEYRVVFA